MGSKQRGQIKMERGERKIRERQFSIAFLVSDNLLLKDEGGIGDEMS